MIIVSNLKKIIPNGLFKTFLSYYYRAFIYNSFLSIKRILFLFTNENNYSSFRLEKNGAKEIISRGYKIYNNYLDVDNLELIKNKFDYLIDLKHNVKANNGFSYSNQNDLRNKSSDIILTQPLLDIPQISKLITDNFFLEIACDFFNLGMIDFTTTSFAETHGLVMNDHSCFFADPDHCTSFFGEHHDSSAFAVAKAPAAKPATNSGGSADPPKGDSADDVKTGDAAATKEDESKASKSDT
jgi:hypothetical protein